MCTTVLIVGRFGPPGNLSLGKATMFQTSVQRSYGADSAQSRVLKNTYTVLAATLMFTAGITWMTQGIALSPLAYLGSIIGSFALLFLTLRLRNSAMGLLALFGFAGLEGLSLGPTINFYLHTPNGSATVADAAGLTALAFLSLSAYVHATRKDFSALGGMLFVGLIVLLVASLVGLFIPSQAYQMAIAGVSALIFCGYILYDTSEIIHGGETNYIIAAMRLYLDIINLFLDLLRLLSRRD
jgi:modulator of FtsH protease